MKQHISSVHTDEESFNCDFCEKNFSQSPNLENHIKNVHTNRNNSANVEIVKKETDQDELYELSDLKIMSEVKTEIDQDEPMIVVASNEIEDQVCADV